MCPRNPNFVEAVEYLLQVNFVEIHATVEEKPKMFQPMRGPDVPQTPDAQPS